MLRTELRNPKTTHIDQMSTKEMLKIINEENYNAVRAVENESKNIALAIDVISEAFKKGKRLIFAGAGTSGRLGVLEAAECPPTFGVNYEDVYAIMAGGEKSVFRATEGAEDNEQSGIDDIKKVVSKGDVVVGISAAGGAAYVIGILKAAKEAGAHTVSLTCNQNAPISKISDISICTDTGAEVVTGSTRMKAGTAHKLVLNMLTTCSMIKTGKVYENMMINLKPSNIKLTGRMVRIVSEITGMDEKASKRLLEENDFSIRKAVESIK